MLRGERVCCPTRDSRYTRGLSRALQSDPCPLPPGLLRLPYVTPSQLSIPFLPIARDARVATTEFV